MIRALTLLATLIVLTVVLWPLSAAAQFVCGDRDEMIKKLGNRYGERQIWAGLAGGRIFEIWVTCPDGTWTILRTSPRGIACVVAAGDGWRGAPCIDRGTPTSGT